MSFSRTSLILLLLVAAGFVLRLVPATSSPLLYDEYQWLRVVDQMSLNPSGPTLPLHGDQHPPGQVYWTYPGKILLGSNLLGYRTSSVLLGTAMIPLAFLLGKTLAGVAGGLTAALLFAFNEYLIGVSRLCTEKSYLAFALLSLLLVWRAVQKPSTARILLLGTALGLALLTKHTAALWVPPLALVLYFRAGGWALVRRPALWWGVLATLLVVAPDLVWSVRGTADASESSTGFVDHLRHLSLSGFSWGPLSLFIRPLYYYRVQGNISEYASMSTLPGSVLIVGAFVSLFVLNGWWSRFLQLLGFGTFLFFTLFSAPRGEFWWADLSLLSFLLLTSGVLAGPLRRARILHLLVAVAMIPPAIRLAGTTDNYFPLDWGSPAPSVVERYQNQQTFQFLRFRDRDHVTLFQFRTWTLPAMDSYRQSLEAYAIYLEGKREGDAKRQADFLSVHAELGLEDVPLARLVTEQKWVEEELARMRP